MARLRDSFTQRTVEAVEEQIRRRASPRVLRLAYRAGYMVLKPWWYVSRPRTVGMKCVVRAGDEVLLVRHTYARRHQWDIPGGLVKPGEDPEATLRREVREELGVEVLSMIKMAELPSRFENKRETLHAFAAEVDRHATVTPSPAEIAAVCWARHDALPPETTRFARRMIARSYWDEFRVGADPVT